jgi:hypothetical protein
MILKTGTRVFARHEYATIVPGSCLSPIGITSHDIKQLSRVMFIFKAMKLL